MKECPSCHQHIQSQIIVCPNCGHSFDSDSAGDAVKKTMMGIPNVDLNALQDNFDPPEEEQVRSTMFGFPVNEVDFDDSNSSSLGEGTNAYEESATQIVDASQFSFPEDDQGGAARVQQTQHGPAANPLRSTFKQGLPSFSEIQADTLESEVSDAEFEDEGRTMVASASSFKFDGQAEQIAQEAAQPQFHDRPRKHETLMGMTLDDLAPSNEAKNTLFSIPTHKFNEADGLSEFSEESEAEEDIPTQAISGSAFMQEPESDTTREQDRQRLLDKLRAHHQSEPVPEERKTRSTMFGLPAVPSNSSDDDLDEEAEEDSRDKSLTPHTGVLKVARKATPDISEVSDLSERSGPTTGVLGKSSYMLSKDSSADVDEPTEENEAEPSGISREDDSTRVHSPGPSLNLSRSLRDKLKAKTEQKKPSLSFASSSQEGATQVAGEEMLEGLQLETLEQKSDATRVASASSADLEASFQKVSTSRNHFNDDPTRQHDLASIREQLGEELFAPHRDEVEAPAPLDATAIAQGPRFATPIPEQAPAAIEAPGRPSAPSGSSGPMFATGPQPSVTPSSPAAPSLFDDPPKIDLDEIDGDDLAPFIPELELEQPAVTASSARRPEPTPAPVQTPVAAPPLVAEPLEEVPFIPMVDAEPIPAEPAYKTVHDTSSPTPPHGTMTPAQAPPPVVASSESSSGMGQTLMMIFAVLGLLSFIAAIVLPLLGVMHDTSAPTHPIVYAPALLAVLALVGALIPATRAKQIVLIITSLAGIGIFAACLLLAAPVVTAILSLVGALFALAAIFFPIFARSV